MHTRAIFSLSSRYGSPLRKKVSKDLAVRAKMRIFASQNA